MKLNVSETKVSVIIPNWNGKHFLKDCLSSLNKQTFKDFEVVLVDNGSTDGSSEYVRQYFPLVKLVQLKQNAGFAHPVNLGIKHCVGEYMVLLNNDTRVDKDLLKNLVTVADRKKEVGMIQAKILNFNNPKLIDSVGVFIDEVGHADSLGLSKKDGPEFEKAGYVFMVSGGGSLIKREVFEKIGFLDEKYFAYYEDVDFCLRAQMKGFKAWYEPKAVIYHVHKGTSKKIGSRLDYLLFRNMMQTVIKDFPEELLKRDNNWLKIVLVNLNTFRYLIFKGHIWAAVKAEIFLILNMRGLLKKRREIQESKVVSDEYIMQNISSKKINFLGL